MALGIDLSNQESYLFLREFHKHYEVLRANDVAFEIYYNIFECEECRENGFSVGVDDCLGGGRYCGKECGRVS